MLVASCYSPERQEAPCREIDSQAANFLSRERKTERGKLRAGIERYVKLPECKSVGHRANFKYPLLERSNFVSTARFNTKKSKGRDLSPQLLRLALTHEENSQNARVVNGRGCVPLDVDRSIGAHQRDAVIKRACK